MSKKVRVAFIGCGRIANLHAGGYKHNPQCEVVALSDLNEYAAKDFAERHGYDKAKVYKSYKKMLEEVKPDLVSICLWTGLHTKVVKACAKAGIKAVHSEKPMAPTLREAQQMLRACQKSGTQLSFNHQRRFLPVFQKAKELLFSGAIGDLRFVEAFVPDNILDWGTHVIDMVFMFNKETPAKTVFGQVDLRKPGKWFGIPFEYAAVGMIYFENGVRALIESGADKEMNLGFRLQGSTGSIEISDKEPYLRYRAEGEWVYPEVAGGLHESEDHVAMTGVIKDVTACMKNGKEPELSVNKAIRTTEVIFSIYESSRSHCRVDLPLKVKDNALMDLMNVTL